MKRIFWLRLARFFAMTAVSVLWLLFVIDIWRNGAAFALPREVYDIVRFGNTPYVISAGLPAVAFCLIVAIPRMLKTLCPKRGGWKKWYMRGAGFLLAVQTACMLPAAEWFVAFARPILRMQFMEKMIICYVRAIVPALAVSALCPLVCLAAEIYRTPERIPHTARQTGMRMVCSAAIAFFFTVAALLILNVLGTYHMVNKGWLKSFCRHNASNPLSAWISIVCAPVVEEIAFRGLICKGLGRFGRRWPAILISAVFFGLWHRNMTQFAYTVVWGIIFGYIVLHTGSILWPMLMHGLSNLLAILAYSDSPKMALGAWPVLVAFREWLEGLSVTFSAALLAVLILVMAALVRTFRVTKPQLDPAGL